MANKFGFDKVLNNMDRLKKNLPVQLANQAKNFFVDSWKKEGWDDGTLKKWPARSVTNKKNKGRALLVKSGALRRAAGQSIRSQTFNLIKLTVALPYAAVHNDGYNGEVKAHTRARFTKSTTSQYIGLRRTKSGQLKERHRRTTVFTRTGDIQVRAHNMSMPQRRFMGDSKTLRKMQVSLIENQIDKIWQG